MIKRLLILSLLLFATPLLAQKMVYPDDDDYVPVDAPLIPDIESGDTATFGNLKGDIRYHQEMIKQQQQEQEAAMQRAAIRDINNSSAVRPLGEDSR